MNLNELPKEISKLEGGKKNLSIAEIKEVRRCEDMVIASLDFDSSLKLFLKMRKNGEKHLTKNKKVKK